MKKYISLLTLCFALNYGFSQPYVQNQYPDFSWKNFRDSVKRMDARINAIPSTSVNSRNKSMQERDSVMLATWLSVKSIKLYGGGGLLGAVTAAEENENNVSTTGSLGFNFATDRLACNIFYSYNAQSVVEMDTLTQFGASLLNPNLSGQSFSFSVTNAWSNHLGLTAGIQLANNLWKMDSVTTIGAVPLLIEFGGYIKPFRFDAPNNQELDFVINVKFIHRSVMGDFNNSPRYLNDVKISQTGFNGLGVSANFIFNDLMLSANYTSNITKDMIIPGLTGSQVSIGVNVSADFIKIKE